MAKKSAAGAGNIRKKEVTRNGKIYKYWEARVSLGRDAGTGKQKQISISGKTQKEVREKLTATLKAIDDKTYTPVNKITVSEWLDEWMETYCINKVKPLTYSAYTASIKNHIKPQIGAIELQGLRGLHVQKLYNSLTERGLSAKTVKNTAAILHKALSVAQKQGIIQFNACVAADLPKSTPTEIKPLTDEEIPLFLKAIENSRYKNAFALCLFAGLREGECLGLSWKQVDFRSGKITINQQLQLERKANAKYYIAKSTKSGKARVITPPDIAFKYLRSEKAKQAENRLKAGTAWDNEYDLVFTDEIGRNVAIVSFYKEFKRIASSIGRPDARPHDLRHTAATVAISSGADIKSVQSLLGHATASFTLNVYAHTSEKMMQDTANRIQGYYDNLDIKKA